MKPLQYIHWDVLKKKNVTWTVFYWNMFDVYLNPAHAEVYNIMW
jgi:hypothetical protein